MIPLDTLAPNFGRARQKWPSAQLLQDHYKDIASTYIQSNHSLIELTKSFVEAVCVTILRDRGVSIPSDATTSWLFTTTLSELGLRNTRGSSKFDKVLSAYNKLTDALNEVRNESGSVAHGKDGFLDCLTDNHMRVYLLSADAMLAIVLNALEGKQPNLKHTREPYEHESLAHLHKVIDKHAICTADTDDNGEIVVSISTNGLDAVELRVTPSEFLFSHDRDAYIELLNAASGLKIT